MDLPPEEKTDFDHFGKIHRNICCVQHNKPLFIGLAWVMPIEQKYFITSLRLSMLIQLIKQIKINIHR